MSEALNHVKYHKGQTWPALIGLYSPVSRSGKSTVAETLQRAFGYQRIKFAAGIHRAVAGILSAQGVPLKRIPLYLEGGLKEKPTEFLGGKTPRWAMETLGTGWGREQIDHDFWVRGTIKNIAALHKLGKRIVVDDLRLPNELEAVKALGGLTIYLEKPDAVSTADQGSDGQLTQDQFHERLTNDGDLPKLRRSIANLLVYWGKGLEKKDAI